MDRPRELLLELQSLEQELTRVKGELFASSSRRGDLHLPAECLLVKAGEGLLAFPLKRLVEVTLLVNIRSLPGATRPIVGSIQYRHELIPVLDIHDAIFQQPLSSGQYLVVVALGEHHLALLVEDVGDIRFLQESDLEARPVTLALPGFVQALFQVDGRAAALVDPNDLLLSEERQRLQQLLQPTSEG